MDKTPPTQSQRESSNAPMLIILTVIIIAIAAILLILTVMKVPEQEPVACTLEAKICPDGSSVGRSGPNCEFAPCPEPIDCPTDVKLCPDGSYVRRESPLCEFKECPPFNPEPVGCPEDLKICPDGSSVGRIEPNCEFKSCPAPSPRTDPCDIWEGKEKKAECYTVLAQSEGDVTICDKVELVNFRYDCVKAYAITMRDSSVCIYAGEENEKACFKSTNAFVNDYNICLKIPRDTAVRKDAQDHCLDLIGRRTMDEEVCGLINHAGERKECKKYIAIELDNLTGCKMLLEMGLEWEFGRECVQKEVNESQDISLCNLLEDVRYQEDCIAQGIKDLRLISFRCTGLDMDEEYLCRALADDDPTLCEEIRDENAFERCEDRWKGACFDTDDGKEADDKGMITIFGKGSTFYDQCMIKDGGVYSYNYTCSGSDCYVEEGNCESNQNNTQNIPTSFISCEDGCEDGECN